MQRSSGWARNLMSAVGLVLHLGVGYMYVASGLVVPGGVFAVLLAAWGALLVLALQRWGTPVFSLLMPFLAAALWAIVVLGFGALFDWKA